MCHRQLNGRPCAGCLGFVPLAQVKLMLCGFALLRGRPCGTVVETEETKKTTTTTMKRTRKRKATDSPPLGGSGLKEAADVNINTTNTTPAAARGGGGNSRGRGRGNKKRKVNNNNGILLTSELTSQTAFLEENDFLTHNGRNVQAKDQHEDQQLGDIILHIPKIPALPPGVDFATADPKTTGYILCSTCAAAKAEKEKREEATAQLDVPRAPGNAVLLWKDPDGNTVAGPGPPRLVPPPPPRPAAAVLPVAKEGEYEVEEEDEEPAYNHHDEVANEHGAEQEDGGLADADGSTDPDYDPPRTVTERDNSTNNDHDDDNNEKKPSYNERHDEAVLQSATTDRVWAWVQMAVSGKQGPGVGRRVG